MCEKRVAFAHLLIWQLLGRCSHSSISDCLRSLPAQNVSPDCFLYLLLQIPRFSISIFLLPKEICFPNEVARVYFRIELDFHLSSIQLDPIPEVFGLFRENETARNRPTCVYSGLFRLNSLVHLQQLCAYWSSQCMTRSQAGLFRVYSAIEQVKALGAAWTALQEPGTKHGAFQVYSTIGLRNLFRPQLIRRDSIGNEFNWK